MSSHSQRPTRTATPRIHRTTPLSARRPALYLGTAVAGALLVGVLAGGPPASADSAADSPSASVAQTLGVADVDPASAVSPDFAELGERSASRDQRSAEAADAAFTQAAADQAELDRRAEAERQAAAAQAAAQAAAEAQAAALAQAAAEQQAAQQRAAAAAAAASSATTSSSSSSSSSSAAHGSYRDYALTQVGGSAQFSCLENLWGKESGWNPSAQNSSSSAYGIPQFLDSTWASTGIAKTSDGYRQIDAGLIYIDNRYGSPCGAWSHSQSTGWY